MTCHFKAAAAALCMEGRVSVAIAGRRWQVQRSAWMFFGDDIKLGGRRLENNG